MKKIKKKLIENSKIYQKIFITNFRNFDNILFNLSDVMFVVGENNTNKTSFLKMIDIVLNNTQIDISFR
jgi:predicted ATP-dependent endonuclease of OLD family